MFAIERLLHIIHARRLDRVGAAYALSAWIFVQGAAIALPTFSAPSWIMQWLIAAAALGFPAALVIAWLVSSTDSQAHITLNRSPRNWLLSGVVVLVLIASVTQLAIFWPTTAPRSAVPVPPETSIAVLPFATIGGDDPQSYFSDGIADELIGELSRVPALRVAARTSSFSFRGTNADIRTIAQTLGVRTVLEGSVRTAGARVRITARLVNAADGFRIWSEIYERDTTDILAVESEIAASIAAALTHELLPKGARPARPSIGAEAYRRYLEGRFNLAERKENSVERAIGLFKDVIAREPGYADAYAWLGQAYVITAFNDRRRDLIAPAKIAIGKALALDPGNIIALLADSALAVMEQDWWRALAVQRRLKALRIESADVMHGRANFLAELGLHEQAAAAERAALARDPLRFILHYNLAVALEAEGKPDESLVAINKALALAPDTPFALSFLCDVQVDRGDLDAARRIAAKLAASLEPSNGVTPFNYSVWNAAFFGGDRDAALRMLDDAARNFPKSTDDRTSLGQAYHRARAFGKAMDWYERAVTAGEPQFFQNIGNKILPAELADHPRWKALMQKPVLQEWAAVRAEAARELAQR